MQLLIDNWSATLLEPAEQSDTLLTIEAEHAAKLVGLVGYVEGAHYAVTAALLGEEGIEEGVEIAWEIIYVISNAAGVLTVLRGQEGTSPLDLPLGTQLSIRATAGLLTRVLSDVHALGRFPRYPEGSPLVLPDQVGAYIYGPLTNAAAMQFGFDYASNLNREINITIDMYSPDSGLPFDLALPEGWGILCDLPAGSEIDGGGETPWAITLPASEAYFIEIRGLDFVRLSIRTKESYQYLD